MNQKGNTRQSGIELLRIVSALFVVVLHYCNPQMGGGLDSVALNSFNYYFLTFCICLCTSAVNIFILISGFFLIKTDRRTLGKPFSLILQVILFHIVFYFIRGFFSEECPGISIKGLIYQFIPTNYFVSLYTVLYLLSPVINKLLNSLSKDSYKKLLCFMLIVFSLYPSFLDLLREITGNEFYGTSPIGNWGSQYGYTIVNFILLYSIGGYLQLYDIPTVIESKKYYLITVCLVSVFLWRLISNQLTTMEESSATSYLNPLIILIAVLIFVLFKRITLENKIVNELSKAAFTCFVFHIGIIKYIGINIFTTGSFARLIVHLILCLAIIYLASYIIYKVYLMIFNPLIKVIDNYRISFTQGEPLIIKNK